MIEGIAEREPKKDVCHSAIVLKVLFQKWFPLEGIEPQEKKKQPKRPQEDRIRKEIMRKRF
jgi:hypothetical protein